MQVECAGSGALSSHALPSRVPAAVLMGCSSAKLFQASRGSALSGPLASYLAAGSPCVVGNLWDVTDRDIDRFTTALLKQCVT
jgi:hypothetical protein